MKNAAFLFFIYQKNKNKKQMLLLQLSYFLFGVVGLLLVFVFSLSSVVTWGGGGGAELWQKANITIPFAVLTFGRFRRVAQYHRNKRFRHFFSFLFFFLSLGVG